MQALQIRAPLGDHIGETSGIEKDWAMHPATTSLWILSMCTDSFDYTTLAFVEQPGYGSPMVRANLDPELSRSLIFSPGLKRHVSSDPKRHLPALRKMQALALALRQSLSGVSASGHVHQEGNVCLLAAPGELEAGLVASMAAASFVAHPSSAGSPKPQHQAVLAERDYKHERDEHPG